MRYYSGVCLGERKKFTENLGHNTLCPRRGSKGASQERKLSALQQSKTILCEVWRAMLENCCLWTTYDPVHVTLYSLVGLIRRFGGSCCLLFKTEASSTGVLLS
jgi:hypothetical protein